MLVLSRKVGEMITIGSSITVTILSFDRGVIRLGIEAPKDVPVHRKEVYDKIIDLNKKSSQIQPSAIKSIITETELKINSQSSDKLDNAALKFKAKKK